MHLEVEQYVEKWVQRLQFTAPIRSVLDLGGRDVNGTLRQFMPDTVVLYHTVDRVDGPGVTHVADAERVRLDMQYDLVLCTEVFEHAPEWGAIILTAKVHMHPYSSCIFTWASEGRPAHGVSGASLPAEGEYYRNLPLPLVTSFMQACGFTIVDSEYLPVPGDGHVVACLPNPELPADG